MIPSPRKENQRLDNQNVIKAAVQNAVSKGIRDIRRDPRRSIRKLVDLGVQMGKGRFQKLFFEDAQTMLKNENSCYYDLVTSLVMNTEPKTLETVGVSIGYMSWSKGARAIREYEAAHEANVPWTLFFDLDQPSPAIDLSALVQQGQQIGIHTCFLLIGKNTPDLLGLLKTLERLNDCAFILLSESAETSQALAESTLKLRNVVIAPAFDQDNLALISEKLHQKGRLTALARMYDEHNADEVLRDAFLRETISLGYPFLLLAPTPDCGKETQRAVREAVLALRAGQRYPVFIVDLYSDVAEVDRIISDEPCAMSICGDGTVFSSAGPCEGLNAVSQPLSELIARAMPRAAKR